MSFTKPNLGAEALYNINPLESVIGPLKHGNPSQLSRAFGLGSYFLSGCMAINAGQLLGGPLYLINKDWYYAWIALTKQSFGLLTMTMTQFWAPTIVRVSGDASVRGELLQTLDGRLLCNFPERLVLIANHQIYTDWLYLWWIGYTAGMHGRVFIVLKESLRRIPVIGWGMQLSQFIFLKRKWELDKPHLAKHLERLNSVKIPMWLMMFPEGTNLAPSTRAKSQKWASENGFRDMQHVLLPRSTGLQFCLQELRKTTHYVYDCTIAYEGVPRKQYAQDIFTLRVSYLDGRPPKSVNMYWRRFAISSIPIDDSKAFDLWLRARWAEKDQLLEGYLRTGNFPADRGIDKTSDGRTRQGAGYIQAEVKASYWYDFMQVFAPIGLFAMVLYMFYGALPKPFVKSIKKQAALKSIRGGELAQHFPSKIKGTKPADSTVLAKKIGEPNEGAQQHGIAYETAVPAKVISKNTRHQKALIKPIEVAKPIKKTAPTRKPQTTASIASSFGGSQTSELTNRAASVITTTSSLGKTSQTSQAAITKEDRRQTGVTGKDQVKSQKLSLVSKKPAVRKNLNASPTTARFRESRAGKYQTNGAVQPHKYIGAPGKSQVLAKLPLQQSKQPAPTLQLVSTSQNAQPIDVGSVQTKTLKLKKLDRLSGTSPAPPRAAKELEVMKITSINHRQATRKKQPIAKK